MVWMLVCYEHRIKISQRVPGVGDVPRIDKNPSVVGLGEQPHAQGGPVRILPDPSFDRLFDLQTVP